MSHNWLGDNTPTEWRVIEAMECKVIPFRTAAERDRTDADKAEALLSQAMEGFHKKLVVLDDDPTGVQTVHDVSVYTDWEEESIRKGFEEKENMFFILTNSRSFSVEETTRVHLDIAARVAKVARELGQDFMIISRGDSTLRGHYPLETQLLADGLTKNEGAVVDGVGANGTPLKEGTAIMVDMAGNYTAYMTDMTRVFSVGHLTELAYRAHQTALLIESEIENIARPGTPCAELYEIAAKITESQRLGAYFMGTKQQAKFVGHGIGIQINELPVLTPRSKDMLEPNMVFALEPKYVIPGIGAVGIENSFLVTETGLEKITHFTEDIIQLDK